MDEVSATTRRLIVGVTALANVIGAAVVVVLLSVVLRGRREPTRLHAAKP
jgi:hypothetical protein